ncbi:MAG: hypothetical protein LBM38_01455 [Clostridiales bacterium]|jgi:hypothetical protein|nr:hypothetical protein [Clostridiales bacterium]
MQNKDIFNTPKRIVDFDILKAHDTYRSNLAKYEAQQKNPEASDDLVSETDVKESLREARNQIVLALDADAYLTEMAKEIYKKAKRYIKILSKRSKSGSPIKKEVLKTDDKGKYIEYERDGILHHFCKDGTGWIESDGKVILSLGAADENIINSGANFVAVRQIFFDTYSNIEKNMEFLKNSKKLAAKSNLEGKTIAEEGRTPIEVNKFASHHAKLPIISKQADFDDNTHAFDDATGKVVPTQNKSNNIKIIKR